MVSKENIFFLAYFAVTIEAHSVQEGGPSWTKLGCSLTKFIPK